MIIARDIDKDEDSSRALYDHLSLLLDEAQARPEWEKMGSAAIQLAGKDCQRELRRLAREIDGALVSIELMHAFPGHCELCPV